MPFPTFEFGSLLVFPLTITVMLNAHGQNCTLQRDEEAGEEYEYFFSLVCHKANNEEYKMIIEPTTEIISFLFIPTQR